MREGAGEPAGPLVQRCKAALADYKCPKDGTPRTAVGKPDFTAIHSALERR